VDQRAEARVLLRRPAHHSERPDRIAAVVDAVHVHERERVHQAVVAEMVTERAFRLRLVRPDHAGDDEVGVGGDAVAVVVVK
jgi:hypothetical protein